MKNKYKFIGKPDNIFPYLITGKTYDLEIKIEHRNWLSWLLGNDFPVIVKPIQCPYSSWRAFYKNWVMAEEE